MSVLLEWTIILVVAALICAYLAFVRLCACLWSGGQRQAKVYKDGNELVVHLKALLVTLPETNKLKKLRISLVELRVPIPFLRGSTSSTAPRKASVLVQGVEVTLRYEIAPADPALISSVAPLLSRVATAAVSLLLRVLPLPHGDLAIRNLELSYPVRGLYPGRLVIDEVAGEGSLGSTVKAVFREAHGQLELDGTPLATFCADAPTFSATLAGSLEIKVETRRAVAQPQSYRIASAVSQPLVDPATAASATKVGGGTSSGPIVVSSLEKRDEGGFDAACEAFSFGYTSAGLEVSAEEAVFTFSAAARPLAEGMSAAEMVSTLAMLHSGKRSTTINPLRAVHIGVRYEFSADDPTPAAKTAADDFEVIDSAGSLATKAASGSLDSELPVTLLPSRSASGALPSRSASGALPARPPSSAQDGLTSDYRGPSEARSQHHAADSADRAHSSGGNSRSATASAGGAVLIVQGQGVVIAVKQQTDAFRRMSGAAERLASNMKALVAQVAARATAAGCKSGGGSSLMGVTAKVDDASLQIDGSTATAVSVGWNTEAGLLVSELEVKVNLVVPVAVCQMATLTLRPGGVMAVESLTLEAGRLGKLLLFKLVARGVGYTADAQEFVLAQWASHLGGVRMAGGERFAGTLEMQEDPGSGGRTRQVVRRMTVPPGVVLTQVFRASSLLTGAAAEKVAEEQGLLHLRALDTAAIKPVSGPSVLKAIPPAGFGLDFLPGFKAGFRIDYAVQTQALPPMASMQEGLSAASNILGNIFRR